MRHHFQHVVMLIKAFTPDTGSTQDNISNIKNKYIFAHYKKLETGQHIILVLYFAVFLFIIEKHMGDISVCSCPTADSRVFFNAFNISLLIYLFHIYLTRARKQK